MSLREYVIHDEKVINGFEGDYRFLSNFYNAGVYFEGTFYPSTENAYQAAKTLDERERRIFRWVSSSDSKKLGRKLDIRKDWDSVKIEVMSIVVFDKFYRNKELRQKLIETGDRYLEETNHWNDTFWGVCNGVGENHLGKVLMKVRNFWKND